MGGPLESRFCLYCYVNVRFIEKSYKLLQRTSHVAHDGSLLMTVGFQFMECEEDLKHESHSARHFG